MKKDSRKNYFGKIGFDNIFKLSKLKD